MKAAVHLQDERKVFGKKKRGLMIYIKNKSTQFNSGKKCITMSYRKASSICESGLTNCLSPLALPF